VRGRGEVLKIPIMPVPVYARPVDHESVLVFGKVNKEMRTDRGMCQL
jgi:hypothetical protein